MFHPKKIVTVLGISTLLLSPLAPTFWTADGQGAAFAGNGNGGGNGGGGGGGNGGGGGGGNGGGNGGGGKAEKSRSSEGGGNKPAAAGKPAGGGESVARAKPQAAKPKAATQSVTGDGEEITFARNELGNMNGAMNANINAVLAHIRNGNYSGPVGVVAGLVAADAKMGDVNADDILARAEAWETYDSAVAAALEGSDYATLEEYIAARDAAALEEAQYQTDLAEWDLLNQAYIKAQDDLALGLITEDQLPPDPGPAPTAPESVNIEAANDLIGTEPEFDPPTEEELAAVEEAAQGVSDAEAAVLDLWNKNPGGEDEMTPEEQALLDQLRARFADDLEAIADAVGS